MGKPSKKRAARRYNLFIGPDIRADLDAICRFHGWTYIEAARRLFRREKSLVDAEAAGLPSVSGALPVSGTVH